MIGDLFPYQDNGSINYCKTRKKRINTIEIYCKWTVCSPSQAWISDAFDAGKKSKKKIFVSHEKKIPLRKTKTQRRPDRLWSAVCAEVSKFTQPLRCGSLHNSKRKAPPI